VGTIFGVMKRGWSRCLLVMVSLGWGVTRDSLGRSLKWIFVAGLTYVGVAASRDISLIIAVDEIKVLSQEAEQGLFDVYTILTFVVAALDVLFAMWILDALASTMEYLQGMKQTRKLSRYIRLRCLFLFAILFAMVWVIFALVTSVTTGIIEEEDAWLVEAATEINYFVVLVGVSILWRPNPSAREYAYAMELPAMRDDGMGGSELELTGTVPSAMDSFDDEDEEDHAFRDAITPPGKGHGGYVD
jgi:Lung seven transmembrane receptor